MFSIAYQRYLRMISMAYGLKQGTYVWDNNNKNYNNKTTLLVKIHSFSRYSNDDFYSRQDLYKMKFGETKLAYV